MIFITLGTQDKNFKRLLKAVDKQIELGNIRDKVIVQAGYTKYNSNRMTIFDFLSHEDELKFVDQSDLIITHGGVASIMEAITSNKKTIAVPRLKKYNEHDNDHQLQIIDSFSELGYLLPLKDLKDFDTVLLKINKFEPKPFVSNTNHIIKLIENFIEEI